MPATMIHLQIAYKINPSACGHFFMGCFAPDYFEDKSDIPNPKKQTHLRENRNDLEWEANIAKFYQQIDKSNPFHMGYVTHLLCDRWFNPEYADDGKLFVNRESRNSEYRIVGRYIRLNAPWVSDVFGKMEQCSDDITYPIPGFSALETIKYKNALISASLRQSDEQAERITPTILTPEFLDKLSDEFAEKYRVWIEAHT